MNEETEVSIEDFSIKLEACLKEFYLYDVE